MPWNGFDPCLHPRPMTSVQDFSSYEVLPFLERSRLIIPQLWCDGVISSRLLTLRRIWGMCLCSWGMQHTGTVRLKSGSWVFCANCSALWWCVCEGFSFWSSLYFSIVVYMVTPWCSRVGWLTCPKSLYEEIKKVMLLSHSENGSLYAFLSLV